MSGLSSFLVTARCLFYCCPFGLPDSTFNIPLLIKKSLRLRRLNCHAGVGPALQYIEAFISQVTNLTSHGQIHASLFLGSLSSLFTPNSFTVSMPFFSPVWSGCSIWKYQASLCWILHFCYYKNLSLGTEKSSNLFPAITWIGLHVLKQVVSSHDLWKQLSRGLTSGLSYSSFITLLDVWKY